MFFHFSFAANVCPLQRMDEWSVILVTISLQHGFVGFVMADHDVARRVMHQFLKPFRELGQKVEVLVRYIISS